MSIEKMYCNESRKSFKPTTFVWSFLNLVSIWTIIVMNIEWSKQPHYTWSCLWNLHYSMFLSFRKEKSCFKLIYIWIPRPISSMEGDEGDIFSKAPDWKLLFLLKIKNKQNSGCPNKEYNGILKHIHQNIWAYPRSKKNLD